MHFYIRIEINFTNDIKIAYLGVHTIFIDI